jgi:hypothetical protein
MYESFIDLDELIVQCRDKLSRKFIQEAVSCYRAGAFRSCIVATWNAVVFDFLHKLRELELFGNQEATKTLEEFERFRSSGKQYRELWQFEARIPEIALTKFELISIVEKSDIERLFEDRSRCAHPSMTSLEEPFEATAELARYHLRSAVTHLLARPPVQGRAACERIFQNIESIFFPIDPEVAIKHFQNSPLARARVALVRAVVIGLTKSLLVDDRSEDERARQFSALTAVSYMYPQETREILNTQLSDIILNKVTDENWDKTILYLGKITAWDSLNEPCRLKAEVYIGSLRIRISKHPQISDRVIDDRVVDTLVNASHIDFLRESVIKTLQVLQNISPEGIVVLMMDHEVEPFTSLVEAELEKKILTVDLEDLLVAKYAYSMLDEPKSRILESIDSVVADKVENLPFSDVLNQVRHWNEIPDNIIEPILKKNISLVIDQFIESNSFYSAGINAQPLVKIASYLSPFQWKEILEAFFENGQLCSSYRCCGEFKVLFEKSMEIHNSVQPYWITFREQLDNSFDNEHIRSLKDSIDTHLYKKNCFMTANI